MKKIIIFCSILSAVVLLSLGCKRDYILDGVPNTPVIDVIANDAPTVNTSVSGIIVNDNNVPVIGATVKAGANTTTTDSYGRFEFKNIAISKNNGFVKVTKTGYFLGSRSFVSVANGTQHIRIKLIPNTTAGNISSATGGVVNLPSGAQLNLAANVVVDASGAAYSGQVNVAMAFLNPTATDLAYTMPGDLRGILTTGQERVLETYGMLGVELTSNTGQPLKIAPGKTAEITFPIAPSLLASAPSTIVLWHFDEVSGRWKEEGTATKTGNNYIANVSHFSFWNCDAPFPLIDLCMHIETQTGTPLRQAQVRIVRIGSPTSIGYGLTDSLGNLCGKVPKNESLTLQILGLCGNVVYSQNIGPFTTNTTLPTIIASIPNTNSLAISGIALNCAGTPVTQGNVLIYVAGGHTYAAPVVNGNFSTTIIHCGTGAVNFTALPVDNLATQQGNPTSFSTSAATINLGNLTACGTSSSEFLNITVDGTPFGWVYPADSLANYTTFLTAPNIITNIYANASITTPGTTGNSATINTAAYPSTPGTYLLQAITVRTLTLGNGSYQGTDPTKTINITECGPPNTGFVAGNFSIPMVFLPGSVNRTVTGSFRVRR